MLEFLKHGKKTTDAAAPEEPAKEAEDALGLFPVDLRTLELDRAMAKNFDEALSRKVGGIVIGLPSDKEVLIACKDPTQVHIYDLVEVATKGKHAQLLKADEVLVDLAIEFVYKVSPAIHPEPWQVWLESKKFEKSEMKTGHGDEGKDVTGTVVDRVDKMIREAIAVGASDIHLETFEHVCALRYRQDGVLHLIDEFKNMHEARAMVKRIKVMANMDIAQERMTQGGRVSLTIGDKGYDLRVSIVPVPTGESVVMRVLHKGSFHVELKDLGFNEIQLKKFKGFIANPHGIILVSGPTGSGKSTTLYASLKSIARPDRKLLTVEDPIEYEMPGIVQVQVNNAPTEVEKRVTFATAIREFMRQDPDVILVGEIRDPETAHVSIQAALTGHLVLSTIHTNDAVGVVNRLKDVGVKPYLIATTLVGAIAQRLIRRVCNECAEPVAPSDEDIAMFHKEHIQEINMRRGKGCNTCNQTGYKGRVAIYEIVTINDAVRELIEKEATALEITRLVRQQGTRSLLQDGLAKAANGLVSLEEVQRVCTLDA